MTDTKSGKKASFATAKNVAQVLTSEGEPRATGSQELQGEKPSHPFNSQILGSFLQFLKERTDSNASPIDAVFHRKYAKYRQMPYPDPPEDEWRSNFMQRTWINVLLHEGMTDELRKELYPGRFDLGNTQSDSDALIDFSELLREINGESIRIANRDLSGEPSQPLAIGFARLVRAQRAQSVSPSIGWP